MPTERPKSCLTELNNPTHLADLDTIHRVGFSSEKPSRASNALKEILITNSIFGSGGFETESLASTDQMLTDLERDLRSAKGDLTHLFNTKVDLLIRAICLETTFQGLGKEFSKQLLDRTDRLISSPLLALRAKVNLLTEAYGERYWEQLMDAEVLFGILKELRGGHFYDGNDGELLEEMAGDKNKLKEACENVEDKTLWVVPNWDCNRGKNPCSICFAKDIMDDAKAKGYQRASVDFFTKLTALSKLPFGEVIITGGEPTQDLELLEAALLSIHPERDIRIITNGDWILAEKTKEEVLAIIFSSKRQVRVDISGHDAFPVFQKKLKTLEGKLSVGAQLRTGEGKDYYPKLSIAYNTGVIFEEHKILGLGQGKAPQSTTNYERNEKDNILLKLKDIIKYTKEKNQGIYLMAAQNGSRVVANHETPYLVVPTPADLVNPDDSPRKVLKKAVGFYAKRHKASEELILDSEVAQYAAACFKTGVPISLEGYEAHKSKYVGFVPQDIKAEFVRQNKKLMVSYYQIISEISHIPVDELKKSIAQTLAQKISEMELLSSSKTYTLTNLDFYPMTFAVAVAACRDSDSLTSAISKGLWRTYRRTEHSFDKILTFANFNDPFDAFMQSLYTWRRKEFTDHLKVLDISPGEIASQLKTIVAERSQREKEQSFHSVKV